MGGEERKEAELLVHAYSPSTQEDTEKQEDEEKPFLLHGNSISNNPQQNIEGKTENMLNEVTSKTFKLKCSTSNKDPETDIGGQAEDQKSKAAKKSSYL